MSVCGKRKGVDEITAQPAAPKRGRTNTDLFAAISGALVDCDMPLVLEALICAYTAPRQLRILPRRHLAAERHFIETKDRDEVHVQLEMMMYRIPAGVVIPRQACSDTTNEQFVVTGVTTKTTLDELLLLLRTAPLMRDSFLGRLADGGAAAPTVGSPTSDSSDEPMPAGCSLDVFGPAAAHMNIDLGFVGIDISEDRWTRALKKAKAGHTRVMVFARVNCQNFASYATGGYNCAIYTWAQVATWFADGVVPTWPCVPDSGFTKGEEEGYLALAEDDPTFSSSSL